jgi:regulator of protease activity HflC (stomatin/prohibitin superfamily)
MLGAVAVEAKGRDGRVYGLLVAGGVAALDEVAANWGVKVLRYEIKDLTPPAEILRSMQAQITAEREKRAVIATSEDRRQEQINVAPAPTNAHRAVERVRHGGAHRHRDVGGEGGKDMKRIDGN